MASTTQLEKRLKKIEREVDIIRKELLLKRLQESRKGKSSDEALKNWIALGKRVSAKWKGRRDAVEEIRSQREKTW